MSDYTFEHKVTVLRRKSCLSVWSKDPDWDATKPAHTYITEDGDPDYEYMIQAIYAPKAVRTAEEIVRELKKWYAHGQIENTYCLPVDSLRFNDILKGNF